MRGSIDGLGSSHPIGTMLPAVFAVAMGVLVGAVESGASLAAPLTLTGVVFVLLQVLTPIHQAVGANLGDRVRIAVGALKEPAVFVQHLDDRVFHVARAVVLAQLTVDPITNPQLVRIADLIGRDDGGPAGRERHAAAHR